MASEHYSLARARRSLAHFGAGKLLSALSGFITLLLAVRVMPTDQYGQFVALLAVLEIFYLLTGFGLSTAVQRYVADYRICASQKRFRHFVLSLLGWRLLSALIGSAVAVCCMPSLFRVLGMGQADLEALPFVLLLSVGVMLRFTDELLPALLLQGQAQVSLLLRNVTKGGLFLAVALSGQAVQLEDAVWIEVAAGLLAFLIVAIGFAHYLSRHHAEGDEHFKPAGMWSVSTRFYLVQIIGQVYGSNALKLLVMRTLGPEATGALGFAQSIVDMIRNYLPAHLLAGWVRPLMVSRYVVSRDPQEIAEISWMIFKLNLIGIVPLVVFFALVGDEAGALASGGKFLVAGSLFLWLSVLLVFQTAHILISLLTITIERPAANLLATVLACFGLPLAGLLAPRLGVAGVIVSLIAAESIWVGVVAASLLRGAVVRRLDASGMMSIVLVGVAVWGTGYLLPSRANFPPVADVFAIAAFVAIAFLAVLAALKPLLPRERELLGKFLPSWILVW
jgi:O-antigen/teichoic acid export membrane protein